MSQPPRGIRQLNARPSLSPSLFSPDDSGPFEAHEVKFLVPASSVARLEVLADQSLTRDPGDPLYAEQAYRVRTIYTDTESRDVYWRQSGYRASKFRLRKYGLDGPQFVERKVKRGTRVSKQRTALTAGHANCLADIGGPADADWFREEIGARALKPVCSVTCLRSAWYGTLNGQSCRVTIDHELAVVAADSWQVPALELFQCVPLPGLICELKFRGALPVLFRDWVTELELNAAPFSKFRTAMESLGLARLPAVGEIRETSRVFKSGSATHA